MEDSSSRAPVAASPGRLQAPKRRRQERTVYRKDQQEALGNFFKENQYPSYAERLALARRLRLQEHQVQVWFKNHRAKVARLFRKQDQGGDQKAGAAELSGSLGGGPALEGPRVPGAMTSQDLGTAAYEPTFSKAPYFYNLGAPVPPSFPEYPGFCNAPPASFSQEPLLGPSRSFSGDLLLGPSASFSQEPLLGPSRSFSGDLLGPSASFSQEPLLGPSRSFSGDLLLGPSASFSQEPLLGPSRSFSGDLLLGPSASFSQEPLLGPSRSFSGDLLLGPSASYFQENSNYYSQAQAWGCLQEEVQASPAPAPAPALPADLYDTAFLSESLFIPDFTAVFESSRAHSQDPSCSSSSSVSGYQEEGDPVGENSQAPQFLDL